VTNSQIIQKVAEIYQWLDSETTGYANLCCSCGKCCDFTTYDHRLYVTTPEMIYFAESIGPENIKQSSDGKCPYLIDHKCSVYENRFASCRIFCCRAEKNLQSDLSELALKKLKSICENLRVPYSYTFLPTALRAYTNTYLPEAEPPGQAP